MDEHTEAAIAECDLVLLDIKHTDAERFEIITGRKQETLFQLIDLKVGPTEDDYMMIEWLNTNKVPYVVIATKCDKVNATTRKANYEALVSHPLFNPPYTDAPVPVVMFSSQTGTGRNDVLAILSELLK